MRIRVPNVRSLSSQWWKLVNGEFNLVGRVSVERRNGETWVAVDDAIPHVRLRGVRSPRYQITSKPVRMPTAAFPSRELRHQIAHDANKARGRALFCSSVQHGPLAAVSFHIDGRRRAPLILCDVALNASGPAENAWALFGVHMLLGYLLEIARKDERPDHIGFLARNDNEVDAAERLGFRPGPRPQFVTGAGTYMRFTPPGTWR